MEKIYNIPAPSCAKDGVYLMKRGYRFTFGKNRGKAIEDVNPQYVAWAYYHVAWLDLSEEILNRCGIVPISKPGTSPEKYEELRSSLDSEFTDEQVRNYKLVISNRNKARAAKLQNRAEAEYWATKHKSDAIAHSKGKLAWKNQGH